MTPEKTEMIGFACAYTPLALIDAAGFAPYRILPLGDWPDQAGRYLHDNLCPHVKRILDRALQADLPDFAGLVFMNSCDAMRRLVDAWRRVRPDDRVVLVDLPITYDERSVSFFGEELARLADVLSAWSGRSVTPEGISESVGRYNDLAGRLDRLYERYRRGTLEGGSCRMQALCNRAMTGPIRQVLSSLASEAAEPEAPAPADDKVPVFLFGNVLPDPEVFSLIESCGARIAVEDLCTGSRQFHSIEIGGSGDLLRGLARALLERPACARTFEPGRPGRMAEAVLAAARTSGARGVIGHTIKFCDPYLARLPAVREALQEAGLPVLLLEGDCTLRSIGQHRTRIEAFVEMLR